MTRADLSAFLDGMVPTAMERDNMAGGVVVVVKDGEILAAKGYGWADVGQRRRVDPDRTLFRIASISQLFTWTAVMQLVEQGRIDLDRDVNDYLDFKIPPAFGKPITLRHLMTHTAGFEEQVKGMFFAESPRLLPLGEAVKRRLPARIFPPGAVTAYSNYGATLAGYIIEHVSGEPFNRYVEKHVFAPLGMRDTSFDQPLPEPLLERLAKAYTTPDEPAVPLDYLQPWPGGSAVASGNDMARFMIAHLQGGRLGDAQVLRADTVDTMHAHASTLAPGMNGWTLGFWEENRDGHRMIGHGGNLGHFRTYLDLLPDDGMGIYLAFNSDGKSDHLSLRLAIVRALVARYLPSGEGLAATAATVASSTKDLAGRYIGARRSEKSFLRLENLDHQALLTVHSDDTISLSTVRNLGGAVIRWRSVGADSWQDVHGTSRLAVVREQNGRVRYLTHDQWPPSQVLQPVRCSENGAWIVPMIWIALATLIVVVVAVPALYATRSRTNILPATSMSWLAYLAWFLNAIVLAVWWFAVRGMNEQVLNEAFDPTLRLLQILGVVAIGGTAFAVVHAARTLRSSDAGFVARLTNCTAALACVAVTWLLIAFHLLGPGTGY